MSPAQICRLRPAHTNLTEPNPLVNGTRDGLRRRSLWSGSLINTAHIGVADDLQIGVFYDPAPHPPTSRLVHNSVLGKSRLFPVWYSHKRNLPDEPHGKFSLGRTGRCHQGVGESPSLSERSEAWSSRPNDDYSEGDPRRKAEIAHILHGPHFAGHHPHRARADRSHVARRRRHRYDAAELAHTIIAAGLGWKGGATWKRYLAEPLSMKNFAAG